MHVISMKVKFMSSKSNRRLSVKEMCVFGMYASAMYVSKQMMSGIPNVHILGLLTVAISIVYRKKAIYPIMIYVLIEGLFAGFSLWWLPYIYLWPLLWLATIVIPTDFKYRYIVYSIILGLHGYLFGILYAPFQAIVYNLSFKSMIAWIIAGLPYDFIHGTSNLIMSLMLKPFVNFLVKTKN